MKLRLITSILSNGTITTKKKLRMKSSFTKMKQTVLFGVIGERTHGESLLSPYPTSHQAIPAHKMTLSGQQNSIPHPWMIQKCDPKS